ncbi:hypothetical protein [Micromonospora tarapacensis]|uniref:hypothetical protein n=1 Tax=Micromonospora tarapacensis TaxID=2835305 RepID=UPI001E2A74F3|nr:hypothetical protein [Micromonospora tarapacensis]
MPLIVASQTRSPSSDQSKLSPRTAYAGSSWPARLKDGRRRLRPGSNSHCISAARVSRRLRRATRYTSVPASTAVSSCASAVAMSANSARCRSSATGPTRSTPRCSPRMLTGRYPVPSAYLGL